jgi:hypothetical protein
MSLNLENEHNVYILGAGFSFDRGLPLMRDFTQRIRDAHPWLRAQGRDLEAKAVEAVLEYRLASTASAYHVDIDLENIEQLFSLASVSESSLDTSIRLAISATIDFVESTKSAPVATFELPQSSPAPGKQWIDKGAAQTRVNGRRWEADAYQFYLACMLGRMLHAPDVSVRNTILTFNYDLVVERALHELGVPFSYGFAKQRVSYDQSATCTSSATVGAVPVLKLHGSVNWAPRPGRGLGFTVFGSYADVRAINAIPALVPPTWDKHFDYHLRAVWQTAVAALSTATRIVVLGFSMPETDLHFRYLLAASLARNISLRNLFFVNPADDLEVRLAKLFHLSGKVLPQVEPLRLNVDEYFARFFEQGPRIGRSVLGEPGSVWIGHPNP